MSRHPPRAQVPDNNRIARACGATIVNRTDEMKEEDIGTGAGLLVRARKWWATTT